MVDLLQLRNEVVPPPLGYPSIVVLVLRSGTHLSFKLLALSLPPTPSPPTHPPTLTHCFPLTHTIACCHCTSHQAATGKYVSTSSLCSPATPPTPPAVPTQLQHGSSRHPGELLNDAGQVPPCPHRADGGLHVQPHTSDHLLCIRHVQCSLPQAARCNN